MLDTHIPTLIFIKWLIDSFSGLDPQVQAGWIAGFTAALSTGLTVWLTQKYASKNLDRTLNMEKAKHQAELEARREDRLFEKRLDLKKEILRLANDTRSYILGDRSEFPRDSNNVSDLISAVSMVCDFEESNLAIKVIQESIELLNKENGCNSASSKQRLSKMDETKELLELIVDYTYYGQNNPKTQR